MRSLLRLLFTLSWLLVSAVLATAQVPHLLSPSVRTEIYHIVKSVLASTGVPSTSISIVKDGQVVYLNPFGKANLEMHTPARTTMRYCIGSVSKQFTAALFLYSRNNTSC